MDIEIKWFFFFITFRHVKMRKNAMFADSEV